MQLVPRLFCGLALAALLAPLPALACLHGPEDYEGALGEDGQEALIFWSDGREELVLRLRYVAEPEAPPPATLAWVIPLPSVPDAYDEADPGVFMEMAEHWEAERERDATGAVLPNQPEHVLSFSDGDGVEVLEGRTVGGYDIQPLRATGAEGAKALNGWLKTHGFAQVPEKNMDHYVRAKWVWLAVRVNAKGKERLRTEGALAPLRISFASERIVYPLKFSTHQGEFLVRLWIVTGQPLPDVSAQEPEVVVPEEGELEFKEEEPEGEDLDAYAEFFADLCDHAGQRYMPLPLAVDRIQLGSKPFAALDNRVGALVPHVTKLEFEFVGEDAIPWKEDLSFAPPPAQPALRPGRELERGPDAGVMARVLRARTTRLLDGEEEGDGADGADRIAAAMTASQRLLELPEATFGDHLLRARTLGVKGDWSGALGQLEEAEAKGAAAEVRSFSARPGAQALWAGRARAYVGLDRIKDAADCGAKLAALPHTEYYDRLTAARLAAVAGRTEAASRWLEDALSQARSVHERAEVLTARGVFRGLDPATRAAGVKDLAAAMRLQERGEPRTLAWYLLLGGDGSALPDHGKRGGALPLVELARDGDEAKLLEAADAEELPFDRRYLLAEGLGLLGVRHELAGRAAEARGCFKRCVEAQFFHVDAWMWSRARLRG